MTRRVMSLVMFAAIGLNPISIVLAAARIRLNVKVLLVCAGVEAVAISGMLTVDSNYPN